MVFYEVIHKIKYVRFLDTEHDCFIIWCLLIDRVFTALSRNIIMHSHCLIAV